MEKFLSLGGRDCIRLLGGERGRLEGQQEVRQLRGGGGPLGLR